jgi:hypothetical protein
MGMGMGDGNGPEPRSGERRDFETSMARYYAAIQRSTGADGAGGDDGSGRTGAVFFAVCRGKVSEGLDFADANARAVVAVGIPYPSVRDPQVNLKRRYNDEHAGARGLLRGSAWYDIQAFRALNQALGRCIRHRHDWGALLLLDERFAQAKTIASLSRWVRPSVVHYERCDDAISSLATFMAAHAPGGAARGEAAAAPRPNRLLALAQDDEADSAMTTAIAPPPHAEPPPALPLTTSATVAPVAVASMAPSAPPMTATPLDVVEVPSSPMEDAWDAAGAWPDDHSMLGATVGVAAAAAAASAAARAVVVDVDPGLQPSGPDTEALAASVEAPDWATLVCAHCYTAVAFVQSSGAASSGSPAALPSLPAAWFPLTAAQPAAIDGSRLLPLPDVLVRCGVRGGVRPDASTRDVYEAAVVAGAGLCAPIACRGCDAAGPWAAALAVAELDAWPGWADADPARAWAAVRRWWVDLHAVTVVAVQPNQMPTLTALQARRAGAPAPAAAVAPPPTKRARVP